MEAEILFLFPGAYKSFDDVEEHLTREELIKMYETAHKYRKEDKRFTAALKGIELDEGETSDFDEIKRRAEAKAFNMTEEEFELQGQIQIIDEDEDDLK